MTTETFNTVSGSRASISAQPQRSFVQLITVLVMVGCIVGLPIKVSLAGVQSSLMELITPIFFLYAIFGKVPRKSPLYRAYLLLLLFSIPPLFLGIYANGAKQALRDFAQIIYMSAIFAGYAVIQQRCFSTRSLAQTLCALAMIFSLLSLFAPEQIGGPPQGIAHIPYGVRIFSAFALLFMFSHLVGMRNATAISLPMALLGFCLLMLYMAQLRTRALLVMSVLGIVFVFLRSLRYKRTAREYKRLHLSIAMSVVFAVVAVPVATSVLHLSKESSVSRLMTAENEGGSSAGATANYRLIAWGIAAGGIIDSPAFGQGFGRYLYLDPWLIGAFEYLPAPMIHNALLALWFSGGTIFFLAFLWLVYVACRSAGCADQQTRPGGVGTRIIVQAFILTFMVYSIFSVTFFDITQAGPFWFIVGAFAQYGQRGRKPGAVLYRRRTTLEQNAALERW